MKDTEEEEEEKEEEDNNKQEDADKKDEEAEDEKDVYSTRTMKRGKNPEVENDTKRGRLRGMRMMQGGGKCKTRRRRSRLKNGQTHNLTLNDRAIAEHRT